MINTKVIKAIKMLQTLNRSPSSMRLRELSMDTGISLSYAEQIMRALVALHLVIGQRGPGGGYVSTARVGIVTVGELSRALGYSTAGISYQFTDARIFEVLK